jgi:HAD domain in Swiss Army Knife RNA repair proteins
MPPVRDVPLLLLDVDGVLNVLRHDPPEWWQHGTFDGYRFAWDPTVTERLRKLHESGQVEIQWLTTWAEDADRLLAEPLGIPRGLRTHARPGVGPTGFNGPLKVRKGWWKLTVARELAEAEPGRRIVWVDDNLTERATDTAEWLSTHPHVHVVAPDLWEGLTHEQLDEIEAWL